MGVQGGVLPTTRMDPAGTANKQAEKSPQNAGLEFLSLFEVRTPPQKKTTKSGHFWSFLTPLFKKNIIIYYYYHYLLSYYYYYLLFICYHYLSLLLLFFSVQPASSFARLPNLRANSTPPPTAVQEGLVAGKEGRRDGLTPPQHSTIAKEIPSASLAVKENFDQKKSAPPEKREGLMGGRSDQGFSQGPGGGSRGPAGKGAG